MACWSCGSNHFASITRAMAKSAAARVRGLGVLATARDWTARAAVCEGCMLRRVVNGVSYCGTPFLRQVERDAAVDGCGCPTREKAKSPAEHCPVTRTHRPAETFGKQCNCKWCMAREY